MAPSVFLHVSPNSVGDSITPAIRQAVELELDAICNDVWFRSSQRNCAFLRYVITETLEGRAAEIKERTLGKELFGRPISYDTGSDAVVRVRANEVRKRLIVYYESHESQAGWRVHLPLRTYVPVFVPEVKAKQPEVGAGPVAAVAVRADETALAQDAVVEPAQGIETYEPLLPLSWMIIPTLVALFLCAATFRWQAFSGTPYLDFWEALLEGHARIALVLDADPADPRAVTTSDLQIVKPLLETAELFHAKTEIGNSDEAVNRNDLLAVHITHHAPGNQTDDAAYITLIPGRDAQLWVESRSEQALDLAIQSISDADTFPIALEAAVRRKTPTRLRFVDREQVLTESLPLGDAR
jgi:hypothetical protein